MRYGKSGPFRDACRGLRRCALCLSSSPCLPVVRVLRCSRPREKPSGWQRCHGWTANCILDPKVVGRFFRHEPLTPEEIVTIRERSAAVDDDLLNRSEREAKAGARIIFWGEANAPVLKEDESDLIQRGGILAKGNGIYLGMVLASWHLETTPALENKIVLVQPNGNPAWEFFKAHPVPGREKANSIRGNGRVRVLDTPFTAG